MLTDTILFFIDGPVASDDELAKAKTLDGQVCFRNAWLINDTDIPEPCSYVTGLVPKSYSKFNVYGAPATEATSTTETETNGATTIAWKPNA